MQVQQDFVTPGTGDLDAPIWAVMGGELLQRVFYSIFSRASELLGLFGRGKRNTTEKTILEIFVTIWESGRI